MTYYVLEDLLEELRDRNYPSTSMVTDVIVQAWARGFGKSRVWTQKKGGRARTTVRVQLTLYIITFSPSVGQKNTKCTVTVRHRDELCETKTVTWYCVRTSTKTILLAGLGLESERHELLSSRF